ncbi:hypothetical protein [endosymbiont GvMRE of Glomus versiforme]|uniref:hypothetical protein n=1 Tax=endosymbiont GvMRE of Glomus versiforme TaxID=2039283 RepID=UPI0011C44ED7|nr:hypothetical protein [endosymbiont GvMRE of Glomus versiforme]
MPKLNQKTVYEQTEETNSYLKEIAEELRKIREVLECQGEDEDTEDDDEDEDDELDCVLLECKQCSSEFPESVGHDCDKNEDPDLDQEN